MAMINATTNKAAKTKAKNLQKLEPRRNLKPLKPLPPGEGGGGGGVEVAEVEVMVVSPQAVKATAVAAAPH